MKVSDLNEGMFVIEIRDNYPASGVYIVAEKTKNYIVFKKESDKSEIRHNIADLEDILIVSTAKYFITDDDVELLALKLKLNL